MIRLNCVKTSGFEIWTIVDTLQIMSQQLTQQLPYARLLLQAEGIFSARYDFNYAKTSVLKFGQLDNASEFETLQIMSQQCHRANVLWSTYWHRHTS